MSSKTGEKKAGVTLDGECQKSIASGEKAWKRSNFKPRSDVTRNKKGISVPPPPKKDYYPPNKFKKQSILPLLAESPIKLKKLHVRFVTK